MASSQSLLDACNAALEKVLSGVAVEWYEGGQRIRVVDPEVLLRIRDRLQRDVDDESGASQPFRPIRAHVE